MQTAVIVDALRSPMAKGRAPNDGRPGGAFASLHPVELLGQVIRALMDRNPSLDPAEVDDVIMGCVSQVREQAGPVGRWAWLGAGLPDHVPATTVDRRCGSSQQAVDFGAMGIMTGVYDVVVAGGVESMSRVPMFSARQGEDPIGPSANRRYAPGLVPQGISSELISRKWGLTRDQLDAFAARSHAAAAVADLASEIVPITVAAGASEHVVDQDETIRPQTTVERLGELEPAFDAPEYRERFPDLGWHTTAGNSSQLSDGAAALLLMSEQRAAQIGLRPRARIHAMAVASADPILMLTGPIPATEKILARTRMAIGDFDHIEVNEAFAPVPLAWREHFDADPERVNPRGGAIALGHPLGASGARLMTSMLHGLEGSGGRWGLQTMCEAGGMANATVIERL
jgi:acetyl-CoA acetyltransferase family protein